MTHTPAGTSVQNIVHWSQVSCSGFHTLNEHYTRPQGGMWPILDLGGGGGGGLY